MLRILKTLKHHRAWYKNRRQINCRPPHVKSDLFYLEDHRLVVGALCYGKTKDGAQCRNIREINSLFCQHHDIPNLGDNSPYIHDCLESLYKQNNGHIDRWWFMIRQKF